MILGLWSCYKVGLIELSGLFFIYAGGLWYYSTELKYRFLIGNIVIALFIALVPFTAGLIEVYAALGQPEAGTIRDNAPFVFNWLTGISFFAFLSTLAHEIVKDMEDMEGDKQAGCSTVPIVWGIKKSVWLVCSILLLMFILLGFLQYRQLAARDANDRIAFFYMLLFIQIPIVFIMIRLDKTTTTAGFHKVSSYLKWLMVAGISYLFLFALAFLRP